MKTNRLTIALLVVALLVILVVAWDDWRQRQVVEIQRGQVNALVEQITQLKAARAAQDTEIARYRERLKGVIGAPEYEFRPIPHGMSSEPIWETPTQDPGGRGRGPISP